jgi:hypothetical protein
LNAKILLVSDEESNKHESEKTTTDTGTPSDEMMDENGILEVSSNGCWMQNPTSMSDMYSWNCPHHES